MYPNISYIKNMRYEGADQNSLVIVKKKNDTKLKNKFGFYITFDKYKNEKIKRSNVNTFLQSSMIRAWF